MTKIYHYTTLKTALEYILPKMQLKTNTINKMNDPKENQPWAFGGIDINYADIYKDTYSDNTVIDHQYTLGNEIKESVQAICFVHDEKMKGFLNEIMWAHYAGNHTGVCLEIDFEIFKEENSEILKIFKFENVTYGAHSDYYLTWNPDKIKEENFYKIFNQDYNKLFLRKSKYWENEDEKRLLIFNRDNIFLDIVKSLTGIYLGLLMPYSYRPLIDYYLKENTKIYDLYYEQNKIKIMKRDKGDYRPLITRSFQ